MASFLMHTNSSATLGSQASSSRTPSGPMGAADLAMNARTSHEDSLYYICLELMQRLAKVPGMLPYMELAYAKAEENSERQAMALSNSPTAGRASSQLSLSSTDRSHSTLGAGSDALMDHWRSTLFTFAAGILPAQIGYDPVTPVWTLLQQGAPLCLIFNVICPEHRIDVVSSDDLKVCKMSVYQFLSACKLHLKIRDNELFPITSVFSDDIRSLLAVIHSINFVLDLDPRFDVVPVHDQLTITDPRSKVVKELVESERKFVYDLETLSKYKDDLTAKELVSSDSINMLFPNLNEIVDFQRRFLVGLECNSAVPGSYQRIGSVFVHAGVQGFQIYEAWSLFQNSALEFINREAPNLQASSSLIANPYELGSFLIKPIQRLCKYPLLLKELLKLTDPSWPNYSELQVALTITRDVADRINEAQRKSENQKLLKELHEKVVDWKGYTLAGLGDLLYANTVTVKDLLNEGHAGEKEVHCYLFERVIYFFKEHKERSKLLSSRKKSTASLASASSGAKQQQLSLNGIVYINKVYKVTSSEASPYFAGVPGHFLTLRWRGNSQTGGCVIRFRSEEHMHQWEDAIRRLSDSGSNGSTSTTNSTIVASDTSALFFKPRAASASSHATIPAPMENKFRSVSTPNVPIPVLMNSNSIASSEVSLASELDRMTLSQRQFTEQAQYENRARIKLTFGPQKESVHLSISPDVDYNELVEVLVNKLNYVMGANGSSNQYNAQTIRLKFRDEDGDLIRFQSDDDWQIAKDILQEVQEEEDRILNVMVC